ncbi:MAG TPA: hypothetical protein VK902_17425 [Rubrobacter sp.]|nr:hypothetical protein [Rubrobacter sp.]
MLLFSLAALLVACAGGGEGRPPEGSGARAVDSLRVETLAEGLDTL